MTSTAHDALVEIASTGRLLVALDFDGTLAPTVDDPAESRALPGVAEAVASLAAADDTVVAIVSGRSLSSLREVVSVPAEVVLVGSHGAESLVDGELVRPVLTGDEREFLEATFLAVEAVAARFSGARVERKPSGFALHTRLASAADAAHARREAASAVQALDRAGTVIERSGKDILEFLIRPADKGAALDQLRGSSAATAVVFIGDDVTDEDGFRSLLPGDAGIKVGEGETLAEFRTTDPEAAVRLLAALAKAREVALDGRPGSRTP